jgi:hypothetical protein
MERPERGSVIDTIIAAARAADAGGPAAPHQVPPAGVIIRETRMELRTRQMLDRSWLLSGHWNPALKAAPPGMPSHMAAKA